MAKSVSTMMDAALEYAEHGLPVIPLHSITESGECTCGAARCHSPGKHPRTPNGLKDATTDPKVIAKWWGPNKWPNASIGGVGGEYLCLDIDAKAGGLDALERLIEANTALPDTAVAETGEYDGSRGLHYWYHVPEGVSAATRTAVREGIDIRCAGGYAVLPPSPHRTGVQYEWVSGIPLTDAAECPEWVLDLVPEHVDGGCAWSPTPGFRMAKDIKQFVQGEIEVPIGEQRDFLTRAARSILSTGRSVETTAILLWEGEHGTGGISNSEQNEHDPWIPEDVYALVSDIYAKPPTTPLEKDFTEQEFRLDDTGNAERLLASFKAEHARYCPDLQSWYIWDDDKGRFRRVPESYMEQRHRIVMEELRGHANSIRSEGESKALHAWAKTSRMLPRVEASVKSARSMSPVSESELDRNPHLLQVANGVVDLRSRELLEAEPGQLLTRLSPVEYSKNAKSKLWSEFLERVIPDKEVRKFLQLACGYSLTGLIDEHKFFYMYGRPATGKSTFLDSFMRIVGTYAVTADTATFTRQPGTRGSTEDLARLAGARVVVTHEVEENERFAAALISRYTGGDAVAARFLYGKTFEFHPRFKLWIAANHRARVSGTRSGIWRRMMVVPMDEVVPREERDPALPRKLREPESQAAILAWAVEGAKAWYRVHDEGHELTPPRAVEEERESYQKESDHIAAFLEDTVRRTDNTEHRVGKDELFEIYLAWCDREGRDRRVTRHVFSRRLTDMGFTGKNARVDGKVRRAWTGVEITGSGINLPGEK
jgi:P4 family phage/plasmid primase-like protien